MTVHKMYVRGFKNGLFFMRAQSVYFNTKNGMTYADAAERIGVSKNNARSKVQRFKRAVSLQVAHLHRISKFDFDRMSHEDRDKFFQEYVDGKLEIILVDIPKGFDIE